MTDAVSSQTSFQQDLAARGIEQSTGVFKDHQITIGKGKPIRIDTISSSRAASVLVALPKPRKLPAAKRVSKRVPRRCSTISPLAAAL